MQGAANDSVRHIQRVYLTLTLLSTLAASFIWGINTLFPLDAGLSNTVAFAAVTPIRQAYLISAVIQIVALPFLILACHANGSSDPTRE